MILCDSGPLIAAAVRTDAHYDSCTRLFAGLRLAGRRLLVPATVAAEVGYLLEQRVGSAVEAAFLQSIADGTFELVSLESGDFARMSQLVAQYDDLQLGTTDASVIALAERLDIVEIATIDQRHFRVVRPSHVHSLTLMPEVL